MCPLRVVLCRIGTSTQLGLNNCEWPVSGNETKGEETPLMAGIGGVWDKMTAYLQWSHF